MRSSLIIKRFGFCCVVWSRVEFKVHPFFYGFGRKITLFLFLCSEFWKIAMDLFRPLLMLRFTTWKLVAFQDDLHDRLESLFGNFGLNSCFGVLILPGYNVWYLISDNMGIGDIARNTFWLTVNFRFFVVCDKKWGRRLLAGKNTDEQAWCPL